MARRTASWRLILLALAGFWILFVGLIFTAPLIAVAIFGVVVVGVLGAAVLDAKWEAGAEEDERVLEAEAKERERELGAEVLALRRLHLS